MFLWEKCGAWSVRYFEEREAPSWTLPICPAPTSAPRYANPCLSQGCISTVWLGQRHCLLDHAFVQETAAARGYHTNLPGADIQMHLTRPASAVVSVCASYDVRVTASSALPKNTLKSLHHMLFFRTPGDLIVTK